MVDGSAAVGEMRGESMDISVTGIQVRMQKCPLEQGFALWLKFQLNEDLPTVVCKGTVARILQQEGEYRVGVQFKGFQGEGMAVLRKFLRLKGTA